MHGQCILAAIASSRVSNRACDASPNSKMAKEGDKKSFVGHDHGKKVEGKDGQEPTTEKQWRDMPKGARPAKGNLPEHETPEVKPETQKATGKTTALAVSIYISSAGSAHIDHM